MELTQYQIDYCMECGVCTGSCPVNWNYSEFSPRQIIKRYVFDNDYDISMDKNIWLCLTCYRCAKRCPVEIDFPNFTNHFRKEAKKRGNLPNEAHHGILQSIYQIHTLNLSQKRLSWIPDDIKTSNKGDLYYFVGCLPYFDIIFQYLGLKPTDSAISFIKILNSLGIEPVIGSQERCCGHDALWSGDEEIFKELAKKNIDTISSTGAKQVLFTCPEGYWTFKNIYPDVVGELPFEVYYATEYLLKEVSNLDNIFNGKDSVDLLTYQDPCRLGRLSNIYESPRKLLTMIPSLRLKEMVRTRENSLCCGTSSWMECSGINKQMQLERLNEGISTGAKTIITACPKCRIHLTCAQENTPINIPIEDIYCYLSQHLK